MALQTEPDELLLAWRALAGAPAREGWHTIPVSNDVHGRVLAGRLFPENREALLVGFRLERADKLRELPDCAGFSLVEVELAGVIADHVWFALCRKDSGTLDLFSLMSKDLVATLGRMVEREDVARFRIFLGRIRAWQDFMRRDGFKRLDSESEIGLFGELEVLGELLAAGVPGRLAVEAWRGPVRGLHDYALGVGAIEVKSTVRSGCFPASVRSLDQLDDSLVRPLFLAGVRLVEVRSGITLDEQVNVQRRLLLDDVWTVAEFDSKLLHSGYVDAAAARYARRFSRDDVRFIRVAEGFPRLVRGCVPPEISRVSYDVDLDQIKVGDAELVDVLAQLGAIH